MLWSSSVARLQPTPAHVEVWNRILFKIIIFEASFWTDRQDCPMSEKNITEMNGIYVW